MGSEVGSRKKEVGRERGQGPTGSRELVEGDISVGRGCGLKQGFNAADGFRREEHIAANATDLRRNVIDDDDLAATLDRVDNRPRFVFARASLNRAPHG